MSEMVERLASQEHDRWSRWMRWMFDNWTQKNISRWKQQMLTDYADLPEHSKESDRKEARRTLKVMREPTYEMTQKGVWQLMIDAALEEPE